MERFDIKDFTGGWFVGDFNPSLFPTDQFEVAVKSYSKGAHEKKHYHKVAVEFTMIVTGHVRMNGQEFHAGSIIKIAPGEATDFEVLEDTHTVVVKVPCAKNDKFLV